MKELDFVKLTLWLSCLLIVACFGGWIWAGRQIVNFQRDIKTVETLCAEVGEVTKDIKVLQEERKNDKLPQGSEDKTGIISYFSALAQRSHFNPGQDYLWKPKEPEPNVKGGWIDQAYTIDFKKDKPKHREQLMKFLYNCEAQSRRIKLQKARLSLSEENAAQDFWNADSLTFVQRSPYKKSGS